MSELSTRIQRIADDLKTIHQELSALSTRDVSGAENSPTVDELLNVELLTELKSTVDDFRQFLWSYIEASAQQSGHNIHSRATTLRLQRATEMLRSISLVEFHHGTERFGNATFFELIERIAATIMEQHGAQNSSFAKQHASALHSRQ